MNLTFNQEQEMLRKTAHEFLKSHVPKTLVKELEDDPKAFNADIWKGMAEVGWMGLPFPEEYGGAGMTFLDLAVLLEEMGKACMPGPYFSTVILGGFPILDVGTEAQKQKYLPQIASGEAIFTFALTEPSASYEAASIETKAIPNGDGWAINGTKLFVPDAHIADYIICVARTTESVDYEEGITLFVVPARTPGVNWTLIKTIASDKQCKVGFKNVRVIPQNVLGEVDKGWQVVKKILERAAAAKCAEMVGGAQHVLDMSTSYAKERVQFDRPIGSFQAIQHHCANMAIEIAGARLVTYQAAWALSEGLYSTEAIAIAKAWTGDCYRKVCALGHQIHGAIGFCKEHDMPLYFRRAKASEVLYGDPYYWRELIAKEIGL